MPVTRFKNGQPLAGASDPPITSVVVTGSVPISVAGNVTITGGTSTVAIVGTSTMALAGTVTDVADGPVLPGAPAGSAMLIGGIYVTPTASLSCTSSQQVALQVDSMANLRITPYGNIGAFQSNVSTSTGTGTMSLTAAVIVPAATKWASKAALVSWEPIGTISDTLSATITLAVYDSNSNYMYQWQAATASMTGTLTSAGLVQWTFDPCFNGHTTSGAPNSFAEPMPELYLGPGSTIVASLVLAGTVTATHTLQIQATVHAVSD
jgi:hypothetical protein